MLKLFTSTFMILILSITKSTEKGLAIKRYGEIICLLLGTPSE